jgi:hypothetical protein
MDYRTPVRLTRIIQESACELSELLDKNFGDLPDEFQLQFLQALMRHYQGLNGLEEDLRSYYQARRSGRRISPRLPKRYWTQEPDWYAVAGMSVWKVHPTLEFTEYASAPAEAEVVVYLDKYSEAQLEAVQAAAIKLGEELGYIDFVLTDEEKGSIFRRFRGKLRSGLASDFVQQKMIELDQRTSIELVGRARAETDAIKTSSAVSLIESLADIPNAVVRVGGLLIIKQTLNGDPAVLTRELSAREIRALELNPGIQKDPHGALELLAAAVAQLEEDERNATT